MASDRPTNKKKILCSESLAPAARALLDARDDVEQVYFPHLLPDGIGDDRAREIALLPWQQVYPQGRFVVSGTYAFDDVFDYPFPAGLPCCKIVIDPPGSLFYPGNDIRGDLGVGPLRH